MKILIVGYADKTGGAARASWRLFEALRRQNCDVQMAVIDKSVADPNILQARFGVIRNFFWRLERFVRHRLKLENKIFHSFNVVDSSLGQMIDKMKPDLVHLHWVGNGALSLRQIANLKPCVFWSLHDEWAFSGAEHYHLLGCQNAHRDGYRAKDRPCFERFLNRFVWLRKKHAYKKLNARLHVTSPSRWLLDEVAKSSILRPKTVHFLPYPLDLSVFKPLDRDVIRADIGIAPEQKMILFGAVAPDANPIKGYDLFMQALAQLRAQKRQDIMLGVFGAVREKTPEIEGLPVHYFDHVDDNAQLARLYNAADVMVVPSRMDNAPQTVTEALACGTPVAAFRVGGLGDYITHEKNGWLAQPYDVTDLARGIDYLLQNDLRTACVQSVQDFDYPLIAERQMELYCQALKN